MVLLDSAAADVEQPTSLNAEAIIIVDFRKFVFVQSRADDTLSSKMFARRCFGLS